jgi:putative hydrolase
MLYDFHTHSFNSDGVLSPVELIHRAHVKGYAAIAIADHLALGSMERVIKEVSRDCELAREHWGILAMPAVELTHLPPAAIAGAAYKAKELGAWLVIVHGETTVEPVPGGTNLAAVKSPDVNILAHPGLITDEEATLAAKNGIYLEITHRRGHSLTNAHVASIGLKFGASLLVNSDAHDEDDLLSPEITESILEQAGVNKQNRQQILQQNPLLLISKVNKGHSAWTKLNQMA